METNYWEITLRDKDGNAIGEPLHLVDGFITKGLVERDGVREFSGAYMVAGYQVGAERHGDLMGSLVDIAQD